MEGGSEVDHGSPSVDEGPAGETQEHVLEARAAHERRLGHDLAPMDLGQRRVTVVVVDEQPIGKHLRATADPGEIGETFLVAAVPEADLHDLTPDVFGDETARRPLGHDPAGIHHDEPVAQLFCLVHEVGGDHLRRAAFFELVQLVPQHVAGLRVEPGRRLVEQKQVGVVDQRPGDRDPSAGKERKDIFYSLSANNRLPGHIGDLRAQVGAAQLGARRLAEMIERFGADVAEAAVDGFIDSTSRQFREEVSSWPDGTYEADVYVDHDPWENEDIHIHCAVTVDGDRLHVDFTGTDDRQELQAWSSYGNTRGYVISQIASCVDPEIPKNEGFFEAVDISVPLGCVLNPEYGKPVSAGTHHPGTEVGEAIALALQQIHPDRAVPQVYKTGIPTIIVGQDPRTGQAFTDHSGEVYAGWCNAAKGTDAWGAQNASFGNLWKATAEINESLYPHIQWSRDYRTDSGGAGQWRGLCGSHYQKEVLTDGKVYTYVVGMKYPMPGIAGGQPGAPNRLVIRYGSDDPFEVKHIADWVPIRKGQRIMYDYGGGGGWGDPLDRDEQAVLDDVLDEYVSKQAAHDVYGVVLTGSLEDLTLAIDHDATKALRERLRAADQ